MPTCIYCGSFDPFTEGHEEIVREALEIFDKVLILLAENPSKHKMFSTEEMRTAIIKHMYDSDINGNIEVDVLPSNMSVVQYAIDHDITHIVRGLRDNLDFLYEMNLATCNRDLSDNMVKTIFIPSSPEKSVISSSYVKQLYKLGYTAKVAKYVAPPIYELFKNLEAK